MSDRRLRGSARRARPLRLTGMLLALVAVAACGSKRSAAPVVGDTRGVVPDLRGRRVMVLPVQRRIGLNADADVDAEIEFALDEGTHEVRWIFAKEMSEAIARAPGIDAPMHGLAVSIFLQAEVERAGDPLFGQLRRIGALVDGQIALIPIHARYASVNAQGELGVEISAVAIDVRTGRVFWQALLGGQPGPAADFATVASAVEVLKDRVLWFMR